MTEGPDLSFPPFRLDLESERLWRGTEPLSLRPKAFQLLRYLVEHRKRLVTQEELLQAIWQHGYVSDGLLRGYIRRLRKVLGDDPRNPRFIETAGRRGYRFIAPVAAPSIPPCTFAADCPATVRVPAGFVGREEELKQLHGALARALCGERRVLFVTGEPGIGKTTLIDAFLAQAAGCQPDLWVGRGQCIEHHGTGEAYLPLFDALGGLLRRDGQTLLPLLRRQAPTWLVQMPALMEESEREALSRQVFGSTQERMERELVEAFEVLCAERPLVLWLEDLHWSDLSTVDLLAMLARRREPARLLVVGTHRPADVIASGHALQAVVRELEVHAQCRSVQLGFLTETEVTDHLAARFALPEAVGLQAWGRFVHRHTDGNPLFMVALVDDLVSRGVLGEPPWPAPPDNLAGGVPENLRQLIEHQFDGLSAEEQGVLESASVAGREFSAAVIAAALDTDVLTVEGCCHDLAQRHLFLDSTPGSTGRTARLERRLSERYRFHHALYPQILSERLPISRRRRLHQAVGLSKEIAYNSRSTDIAAELAVHFEAARDASRAVHYFEQAAQNALRRSAGREAVDLLTRTIWQLETVPETPERAQQELSLQMSLAAALMMNQGYTAPGVKHAYDRAHVLCEHVGETPLLFPALVGLFRFELTRGEPLEAQALAERLLRFAQAQPDPRFLPPAHLALGATLFHLGEPVAACAHLEQGSRTYDRHQQEALILQYGQDIEILRLHYARLALQVLGNPDQALAHSQEALALAETLSHPFTLAHELAISAFSINCAGKPGSHKHGRRPALPL